MTKYDVLGGFQFVFRLCWSYEALLDNVVEKTDYGKSACLFVAWRVAYLRLFVAFYFRVNRQGRLSIGVHTLYA